MTEVSFRSKRLSVRAELPPALAEPLRRLKARVQPNGGGTGPHPSRLLLAEVPSLTLAKRDIAEAVAFLRPATSASGTDEGPSRGAEDDLARQIDSVWWYHTIELPGGVTTPGLYDHRPLLPHYGIPEDLKGLKALDVATFDGYWAFELERRGADVVATDIPATAALDLPPQVREEVIRCGMDRLSGDGFRIAHAALNSHVRRIETSVYDLAEWNLGTFDLVHVGDLLLHLEKPITALRAIRAVTDGTAIISDCFDRSLDGTLIRYLGGWSTAIWWMPSLDALAQMVLDAGFRDVTVKSVYALGSEESAGLWRAVLHATT